VQDSPSWFVIVNPLSGNRSGTARARALIAALREYGVAAHHCHTEGWMHASVLARDAVTQGYRHLLVVGGDGTVNETLCGVFAQSQVAPNQVTLACAGGGTGNDWFRTLGMPEKFRDLAFLISKGKTRCVDVGEVTCRTEHGNSRRQFVNMAGAGLDAAIAEERMKLRSNALAYPRALLRALRRHRPSLVRLAFNEQVVVTPALAVLANIGRYGAGGMKIAPSAVSDDGLFHVAVVAGMSGWRTIFESHRLFDGTLARSDFVGCHRTSRLIVSAEPETAVQADGELIGHTPARFCVIPLAIRTLLSRM